VETALAASAGRVARDRLIDAGEDKRTYRGQENLRVRARGLAPRKLSRAFFLFNRRTAAWARAATGLGAQQETEARTARARPVASDRGRWGTRSVGCRRLVGSNESSDQADPGRPVRKNPTGTSGQELTGREEQNYFLLRQPTGGEGSTCSTATGWAGRGS